MIRRVWTMVMRYVILHFQNPARTIDLFFWPTMELLVWGFLALYLEEQSADQLGKVMAMLLTGLIFWDVLFRSQQAVSLGFMEELWSRNVLNLFISPLKTSEWVLSAYLYGLIKTAIIVIILVVLAWVFYAFKITVLGFYFIPFMFNLLLLGWAMGLFTTGLLILWGHAAEALIWGVPFLIQPFSAIFYPLSVYPVWLKPFCQLLPSTYVMEGMRAVIQTGTFSWLDFWIAFGLNLVYLALCGAFFVRMIERGRLNGKLVRLAG